ncbi:MAG: hypothetical protein HEQ39_06345 [Rhizobacter sp.]
MIFVLVTFTLSYVQKETTHNEQNQKATERRRKELYDPVLPLMAVRANLRLDGDRLAASNARLS